MGREFSRLGLPRAGAIPPRFALRARAHYRGTKMTAPGFAVGEGGWSLMPALCAGAPRLCAGERHCPPRVDAYGVNIWNTRSHPLAIMNDLTTILVFVACLLATFGLVWLCDRLRPAAASPSPEQPAPPENRP